MTSSAKAAPQGFRALRRQRLSPLPKEPRAVALEQLTAEPVSGWRLVYHDYVDYKGKPFTAVEYIPLGGR